MSRLFLIILDSFGIGHAPDAALFGDEGANTLASCLKTGQIDLKNLQKLGLGNINGSALPQIDAPIGRFARLFEKSMGKDTIIGHHEIAGLVSSAPLPTYPSGFPSDLLDKIDRATGIGHLCNRPYSGTEVLRDWGEEMVKTGKVILYTSADSVFQVAAHEDVISVPDLYRYCEIARSLLTGRHAVGRVIARPFVGKDRNSFVRTANRHDFALDPSGKTMLDRLKNAGFDVIAVGKIADIFNGKGITKSVKTTSNDHGMTVTSDLLGEDFNGLCFVNLVDFDMKFGHRRDAIGYAGALSAFDSWLGTFMAQMREDDLVLITADHGCDPAFSGTDHTREAVPMLLWGKKIAPENLGDLTGFDNIARIIEAIFFHEIGDF